MSGTRFYRNFHAFLIIKKHDYLKNDQRHRSKINNYTKEGFLDRSFVITLLSDDFKREGALAKMALGRYKFNDKVMVERLTILSTSVSMGVDEIALKPLYASHYTLLGSIVHLSCNSVQSLEAGFGGQSILTYLYSPLPSTEIRSSKHCREPEVNR